MFGNLEALNCDDITKDHSWCHYCARADKDANRKGASWILKIPFLDFASWLVFRTLNTTLSL